MNRRYIMFFSLLVVLAALSSLTFYWGGQRWNEHLRSSAQRAMDEERFEEAESYASRLVARKSGDREALLLAGEAAMLGGHPDRAVEYFQPLLQGEDADSLAAICAVGEIWFKKGESRKAERMFRRALELDPGQLFATNRLVYLLLLQGRRREELPLRFRLVKAGQFTSEDLRLLASPRAMADNPEIAVSEKAEPDNPQWWLVRGQLALRKGQAEEGARRLRQVVEKRPEDPDAQANLGLALLDSATPYEFWTWHQQVPASAEELADLWAVRGLWARRNNQPEAAVRCFWEALRREPTHQLACYQLALALPAIGRQEEAIPFNQHTTRLRVLISLVDLMYTQLGDDVRTMQLAANFCEEMGRYWEAVGWHHVVLTKSPINAQSRESMIRLAGRLGDSTPQIDQRCDPASLVDFSRLPLPRMERPAETPRGPSDRTGNLAIQFADVAPSSGLNFSYFNGADPNIKGRRMFEFTGGGVAILDYDLDGWPDIYFTQGCPMPSKGREVFRDALFRNLGDGRFLNVTEQAGLGDDRFSQGVTAGDYNSDGYPDLYVGNVGPNRLYRNNGDGTFTDVSDEAGVAGNVWTTSCLIADLDGDRWADLYHVNYLAGNAIELMCPKTCSPAAFDAEADTFYHGRGDGTFVNRTEEAGFTGEKGKGLGIAAFDMDGSGRLSVFVSNDTEANFLYVNEGQPGTPLFTESAAVRGVAFDRDGLAQACMGIGVADANGDQLLDIFVANFYKEFNVLYEQMPGGFFTEVSRQCGLAEPSFLLLTFGVAFVDLELDGLPDIVATNGHVDDFSKDGIPYHMPPCVFSNRGGHFFMLTESCGPFFQGGYLGRGIALVDANRDGKGDWVISHLDSPAALLENRTEPVGNFLKITFVGTQSHRDAIGTTCSVTVGDRTMMQQLVGGCGYFNCNERNLLFGLGTAEKADRIEIRWPSGLRHTFHDVAANESYQLVEGQNELHVQPLR